MMYLDTVKLIAEVITSVATALVVINHLVAFTLKRSTALKTFFKITLPVFFKGHTDITGKKSRFFKGLKQRRERMARLIQIVSPKPEVETFLVLDKKALLDIISNSGAFQTIQLRK